MEAEEEVEVQVESGDGGEVGGEEPSSPSLSISRSSAVALSAMALSSETLSGEPFIASSCLAAALAAAACSRRSGERSTAAPAPLVEVEGEEEEEEGPFTSGSTSKVFVAVATAVRTSLSGFEPLRVWKKEERRERKRRGSQR